MYLLILQQLQCANLLLPEYRLVYHRLYIRLHLGCNNCKYISCTTVTINICCVVNQEQSRKTTFISTFAAERYVVNPIIAVSPDEFLLYHQELQPVLYHC